MMMMVMMSSFGHNVNLKSHAYKINHSHCLQDRSVSKEVTIESQLHIPFLFDFYEHYRPILYRLATVHTTSGRQI